MDESGSGHIVRKRPLPSCRLLEASFTRSISAGSLLPSSTQKKPKYCAASVFLGEKQRLEVSPSSTEKIIRNQRKVTGRNSNK